LDQFIGAADPALEAAFYPSVLEQFRQGSLYALPVDARPLMLYYDVDYLALEEVSTPSGDNWDWGDLLESALKLTRRREDASVSRWGLAAHGSHLWWALWQNEAEAVDAATLQCRLQEPAAIEALQFVHELLHVYRVSPPVIYMDFARLVFEPTGLAPAMVYSSPPIRPPGHYHLAELPRGKVHSVPMYGDLGIGIVARTEKPEAAYTALKGLVDVMQQFVHVPAKKESVARLEETRTDLHPEDVVAIQRSMDHGRAWPRSVPALFALDSALKGLVRGDDVASVVNEACSIAHEYQQS
jgi:multiple sugar transport system substrate-binding protein